MKELFLICPFSNAEMYVRETINPNAFFLTASGSVFRFKKVDYIESVVDFIQRQEIETIYIVGHLECRFLKSAIEDNDKESFYAINHFKQLIQENQETLKSCNNLHQFTKKVMSIHLNQQQELLTTRLEAYNITTATRTLLLDNDRVANTVKQRKHVSNEY